MFSNHSYSPNMTASVSSRVHCSLLQTPQERNWTTASAQAPGSALQAWCYPYTISLLLTWVSTPELCGRVAPQAGPSNAQGSPHTVQGKGLGHQQQLPSSVPWCRGACRGPRMPLKQLSLCHTTASTHWQNRTLQAGGMEGGEGEEPLRYPAADLAAQDPPHLAQPTLPPHTHPASDSEVPQAQAALLEAASTPLREIP